ncbi:hypothetical protein Pint_13696 [Pistacia integerrima]|uniref:Uncharacterized protein n=1 Tax=Pistacia integerrima TaxID=434235 RepID=A0ACC0Y764_9ROSI|nr:hypothetical protein Pint_13696 [Pistacia integerrima]
MLVTRYNSNSLLIFGRRSIANGCIGH